MEAEQPNDGPAPRSPDDEASQTLVARVVRDIASRGQAEHDSLLLDLLCAAWPDVRCQRQ